ncbi:MAG TPA: TIGR03435 family protein [Bryobacteraceae bacterium]|nr:TIGR03435 family protein [Bryobacteraceae bacterium]
MIYRKFLPVSVWFALTPALFCQSQPARPQFDAASVRVNKSSDRPYTKFDATRVELHKASIKHLIRRAWTVTDYQVVWPDWVDAQRFAVGYDVTVTFPAGTSPERLQLMFQDLLATRFGLVTHWETRDLKAFEVTPAEHGAILKKAANPAPPTDFPKYSTRTTDGEWHISSQLGGAPSGLTVGGFLEALNATQILDRPLVNKTGIDGDYDIDLTAPADIPARKPNASELLNALEKQLGLKATLKTIPVKTLIIDRMDRTPTEN